MAPRLKPSCSFQQDSLSRPPGSGCREKAWCRPGERALLGPAESGPLGWTDTDPQEASRPFPADTHNLFSLSFSLIFLRTLISSRAASRYLPTLRMIFRAT